MNAQSLKTKCSDVSSRFFRFVFFAVLLANLLSCAGAQAEGDIFISGIILYTRLPAGSPEAKEHGVYPQIEGYDLHGGLAPKKVDVVAIVNGRTSEEITVVLEVFPVVGLTNWKETEGVTEYQLLDNSKTKLSVFLRLEKELRLGGRTQLKFPDIDIESIIEQYLQKGFWPAELIFKVTVNPISGETALSNNVMEVRFPMKPND